MQKEIEQYLQYLREQEKSKATIQKYTLALEQCISFLRNQKWEKETLLLWKQELQKKYCSTSVNGKLVAINGFLIYMGRQDLKIKLLKVQRKIFCEENKELTKQEYQRLVQTAKNEGKERLSLVIQTICATGIRVSELEAITKEAVDHGRTEVQCKGKNRVIFLPSKLREKLKKYAKQQGIVQGILFRTRTGKALHRGNIWTEMKQICQKAGVSAQKVFPHNLRHLFAKTYYAKEKDIAKLADLLGHCNIETTRIYIMETGKEHLKRLEEMDLIVS